MWARGSSAMDPCQWLMDHLRTSSFTSAWTAAWCASIRSSNPVGEDNPGTAPALAASSGIGEIPIYHAGHGSPSLRSAGPTPAEALAGKGASHGISALIDSGW